MNKSLATQEQRHFEKLEAIIARGLQSFREVGNALSEIRDKQLYRQGFKTFEAYCRARWDFTARRGRQLIDKATIANNVGIGNKFPIPTRENQVVPLAGLEPSEQREVWKAATEIDPNPTEEVVQKIVEQHEISTGEPLQSFNQVNDNIGWAKWSWNPVTGCLHNCDYCYARDIANRFYPQKFEPTFFR